MYGTAHGLAIAACAGGGERACGGIRSGGRERDGRARLLAGDGGMACPQAKAHDYGVVGRPLGTRRILSPLWHDVNTLGINRLQRLASTFAIYR